MRVLGETFFTHYTKPCRKTGEAKSGWCSRFFPLGRGFFSRADCSRSKVQRASQSPVSGACKAGLPVLRTDFELTRLARFAFL